MHPAIRKANSAYYHWIRNRWRWHPRFRRDDPAVPIDRPIFLLGTQGGGLTLTARILRRHPHAICVTGDARYWAGEDEMQNVLQDALPEVLSWRRTHLPGFGHGLHSWMYACDAYRPLYRADASDASPEVAERFRSLLRRSIRLQRGGRPRGPTRFVDKSQTYTLRVGLLAAILRDCDPRFVLLTRDPFAMCWRAVGRVRALKALDRPVEEKLEIAVQHWANSMEEALAWEGRAALRWWRFEDLLAEPERVVREICEFVQLPFSERILPQPDDRIPWGSMIDAWDRSKWYPLRGDLNDRYLAEIPGWAAERVRQRCGGLLERLGYASPRVAAVAGS